jgi:hypothetical protein
MGLAARGKCAGQHTGTYWGVAQVVAGSCCGLLAVAGVDAQHWCSCWLPNVQCVAKLEEVFFEELTVALHVAL